MSAQHTPGPWLEPCTYGASRFEVQGDGRRVAVVDKIDDARLIAAAPDLLAALLVIAENGPLGPEGEPGCHYIHGKLRRAVLLARAAVAKATGSAA